MIYITAAAFCALTYFGWKVMARGAYESAEYTVLGSEGPFETREYPDLMMATTSTQFESKDNDGNFMRLFRYISGANDRRQKVAMTTPVFMPADAYDAQKQMGFVIPKQVAEQRIPAPSNTDVKIRKRTAGRFAVIRFSGRASAESITRAKGRLQKWMDDNNLVGESDAEFAGYDPPWTPGPFRRNEILIRLK